jgi:hypothetical protein
MPTTSPDRGYTIPVLLDPADAPAAFLDLASDVEDDITPIDDILTNMRTYRLRAQRLTSASIPNGAWTEFTTNTGWSETDPGNMRATGSRIAAPIAGWYQLGAIGSFANNTTGNRGLRVLPITSGLDIGGGAGADVDLDFKGAIGSGQPVSLNGSLYTALAAGDIVAFEVYQNSGGSLDMLDFHIWARWDGPL